MQTVAERLKWARGESGLSQRQLAKIAGVSSAYVANVERGLFGIGSNRALRIAETLGVDPSWLLAGSGAEPKPQTIKRAASRAEKGAA